MTIPELLKACQEANATFLFVDHVGDNGQTALDVRAIVEGVRLGLSAHICVHHEAEEKGEAIKRELLEEALEAMKQGAQHWMSVSHKKTFVPRCDHCARGRFLRGPDGSWIPGAWVGNH